MVAKLSDGKDLIDVDDGRNSGLSIDEVLENFAYSLWIPFYTCIS
jgi:hypothetical protein